MNRIFKVVWSKVRNSYVVVSEVAKANSKTRVGRASLASTMAVTFMLSAGTAWAADYDHEGRLAMDQFESGAVYDNIAITNSADPNSNYQTAVVSKGQDEKLTAKGSIVISSANGGISTDTAGSSLTVSAPTVSIKDVGYLSGIHVDRQNAKVSISGFDEFSIDATADGKWGFPEGNGIRVNQDGAVVEAIGNADSSIKIDGGQSGVVLTSDGEINLSAGTIEITTLGHDGKPYKGQTIANTGGGTVNVQATDKIILTNHNVKNTSVYALYSSNGDINVSTDGTLEVTGDIINLGKATIDVTAAASAAIDGDVLSKGYGGTINVDGGDQTTINGAVSISNSNGGGDTVNVGGKNITIDAGDDWGVAVRGGYAGFSKETAANIGTADTESVTVKGSIGLISQYENADINVYGKQLNVEAEDYGIYTGNNSECYTPTAEVNVYSDQTKVTMAEDGSAIVAFSDSTLNIHGGLETTGENAILVRGQSTVNVNTTGEGVVKLDGNIEFNNQYGTSPHVSANNNVTVNMTTADSYLNGKIYVANTSIGENGVEQTYDDVGTDGFGGMVLNMSNGATWKVTDDSFVNTIGGTDGKLTGEGVTVTAIASANEKGEIAGSAIKIKNLTIEGVDLVVDTEKSAFFNTDNTIVSDSDVTIKSQDKGMSMYGDISIDAKNITVESTDDALYSAADQNPNDVGNITLNAEEKLSITSKEGYAINNASTNEGVVNVSGSDVVLVSEDRTAVKVGHTIGNDAYNGTVNIDGTNVTIEGATRTDAERYASVIFAQSGTVNVTADEDITVTNTGLSSGNAIGAYDGGTINAEGSNVTIDGDVYAKQGTVTVNAQETNTINGSVLAGYEVNSGTTEINLGGQEINIDAQGGFGATAWSEYYADEAKVTVNVGTADTETINIENASYGLMSYGNGTEVNVEGKELNITDTTYGIWSANRSISTGDNLDGGDRADDAKLIIGADTDLNMSNVDYGIITMSQGTTEVAGNVKIDANKAAIDTRGEAVTKINAANDETKIVQITGDIVFDYDDYKVDSDVILNLANAGSYLNGNIYLNTDQPAPGHSIDELTVTGMQLGLADGAQWTTKDSGASSVSDLTMDGGIINQNSTDEITIDNLTGEGNVVFNSDSGQINVMAAESGAKLNLSMAGTDADSFNTNDDLNKVANKLDAAEAATANLTGNVHVDEGLLNGAIDMTVEYEDIDGDKLLNGVIKDVQQATTTTTTATIGSIAANAAVAWRDEDATLSQRLGELRESRGSQGVWARMTQGEFERGGDFETEYNTLQIGYDKAKDNWHYGAAVSHSEGDTVYGAGSGEIDSTSLSVYGTWQGDKGHYKDIVAKIGVINNEYTINAANQLTKGDYDTVGTSISGEYGMKQDIGSGWYVNPLAKMTYMHIGSADYTTNNGINVKHKSVDSLIARLGAELGKQIGEKGDIYIKASALHDFGGDADTILRRDANSAIINDEIGGTWYEIGLGFNYKTSDATYLYADVIKTYGDEIRTPWQWNAGVRYSF